MYTVVLECNNVPAGEGEQAAIDITTEFREHRRWHRNATCTWTGSSLVLEVENDFDDNGLASLDEFSDSIAAYVATLFDGSILIRSVTKLDPSQPYS